MLEPFQYEFFQRATWAAVLIGGLCGFIGLFVVAQGMSYAGHGISHAVFGGAAVAYLLDVNFYAGAALAGIVSMLLVQRAAARPRVGADAAIGVVTTAAFAVGVAVMSRARRGAVDFEALLFGDILGVGAAELRTLIVFTLLIGAAGLALYRPLVAVTLDPTGARLKGMKVRWVETAFALLLALVLVVGLRLVGATLISAALVAPAAAARLVGQGFDRTVLLSVLFGAGSGFLGMYLSYIIDTASGAAIVLVSAALFALVYGWKGRR